MGASQKTMNYLFAVVFASLLLASMAGGRKMMLEKHQVESMGENRSVESSMQQQEDDAMPFHERILRQVKTNDYSSVDPTPTMAKPHAKQVPN